MTTKITEKNISNLANIGVQWQSVFTGDGSTGLTTVAGRGYFIDTTSGTVTVTLPASPSAGDVVVLKDYARTWGTNNITIASNTFDGTSKSTTFSTTGQTVTLVYMDGTKGWSIINEDTTTDLSTQFIAATGGTITTSGDFKIHTFTGDGCFVVSQAGVGDAPSVVDYLVVAGGGAGGTTNGTSGAGGGGGGAGGYRESSGTASGCYTVSPLGACVPALTVSATTYPVTVGAGAAAVSFPQPGITSSNSGSNSVFSTITSTGGGGGSNVGTSGNTGGSGGGAANDDASPHVGATGNTPPVSPPQGNPGGGTSAAAPFYGSGGGGGATAAGVNGTPTVAGNGGAGATSSINETPTIRAGGGGGGTYGGPPGTGGTVGSGGPGGGGQGSSYPKGDTATAGTANTGGGGGGTGSNPSGTLNYSGKAGGKGIVIIRYKFQ